MIEDALILLASFGVAFVALRRARRLRCADIEACPVGEDLESKDRWAAQRFAELQRREQRRGGGR